MTTAIVGFTGFVGSYLASKVDGAELYNSSNVREMRGRSFSRVYFAGLPAAKWIANRNPSADLENLRGIQGVLSTCSIETFYLISTIDVFDKRVERQDEDGTAFSEEPYGRHRRDMEAWIEGRFAKTHVLRLPALFGVGLKKNALYDLLTGNKEQASLIHPEDSYQWYDIENLWGDIAFVTIRDIRVANLFSEPIEMREIAEACFPGTALALPIRDPVRYEQSSKHSELYRTRSTVLRAMREFVDFSRALEIARSRIAVSNLCWERERLALCFLKRLGILDLEIAPTKYASWDRMIEELDRIRSFEKAGLRIYSMQSLFFGVPHNVFENAEAFVRHFELVGVVARALGARRLVFGSPKNRRKPESMPSDVADRAFVEAMRRAAALLPEGVDLCIEPNATEYACNFLTTLEETASIVRKIDRENVRVNFDTGNAAMAGDSLDVSRHADRISHVQLSAPRLASVDSVPDVRGLDRYSGRFSLEAASLSPEDFEKSVRSLVTFAAKVLASRSPPSKICR